MADSNPNAPSQPDIADLIAKLHAQGVNVSIAPSGAAAAPEPVAAAAAPAAVVPPPAAQASQPAPDPIPQQAPPPAQVVPPVQPSPTPQVPQTAPTVETPVSIPHTHANVMDASLDDDSIGSGGVEKYKGRKDITDRIGLLAPRALVMARTHYVEKVSDALPWGYLVCESTWTKGPGGQEVPVKLAPCCERYEVPRKRFVAMIIHYGTDDRGKPYAPLSYRFKVWQFGDQIWDQLRATHSEWPLDQHDLLVTCSDEKYQRVTIQNCRESIVRAPAFLTQHGAALSGWMSAAKMQLERVAGRKVSPADWAALLSGGKTPSRTGPTDTPPVVENIEALLKMV